MSEPAIGDLRECGRMVQAFNGAEWIDIAEIPPGLGYEEFVRLALWGRP